MNHFDFLAIGFQSGKARRTNTNTPATTNNFFIYAVSLRIAWPVP